MFLPATWVGGRACVGGGAGEPRKEGVAPGDSSARAAQVLAWEIELEASALLLTWPCDPRLCCQQPLIPSGAFSLMGHPKGPTRPAIDTHQAQMERAARTAAIFMAHMYWAPSTRQARARRDFLPEEFHDFTCILRMTVIGPGEV